MERMKYIRLLWLLLPFLWQSCAEDKGNYDYKDLNDLNISFDDVYSAISREPFVIKPEVTAKEFAPDAYTYEWKAYDQAGARTGCVGYGFEFGYGIDSCTGQLSVGTDH